MGVVAADSFKEAAASIITGNDRGNELLAGHRSSGLAEGGQHGRQDDRAGVIAAAGIVEFECMRRNPIEKGRVTCRQASIGTPDRRVAGCRGHLARDAKFHRSCSGKRSTQRIANMDLRRLDDIARQVFELQRRYELRQEVDRLGAEAAGHMPTSRRNAGRGGEARSAAGPGVHVTWRLRHSCRCRRASRLRG
jgi:hypothetical protein